MGIRSKKQRIKYVDYRTEIKVRSEVPIIGDHKQLAHVVKLSLSLWGLFAQMPSVIIQRRIFYIKKSSFRKFAFTFVIAF